MYFLNIVNTKQELMSIETKEGTAPVLCLMRETQWSMRRLIQSRSDRKGTVAATNRAKALEGNVLTFSFLYITSNCIHPSGVSNTQSNSGAQTDA